MRLVPSLGAAASVASDGGTTATTMAAARQRWRPACTTAMATSRCTTSLGDAAANAGIEIHTTVHTCGAERGGGHTMAVRIYEHCNEQ